MAYLEVCLAIESLGLDMAGASRYGGVGLVRSEYEHVSRHGLVVGDANDVTHLQAVVGGGRR